VMASCIEYYLCLLRRSPKFYLSIVLILHQ
jgi:hypothetical protein